jgi:acetyl-CoA acetyltransferase family protein
MVKWFNKWYKNEKREPVIVDYVRTPLGSKKAPIQLLRGDDLVVHCLKTIWGRNKNIELEKVAELGMADVICGCNSQIGACAIDVAKTSAMSAEFPMKVPGVSLNRQCASGMQSMVFAYEQIGCGDKDVVFAGGVETQNVFPIGADMTVPDGAGGTLTIPPNPKIQTAGPIAARVKEWEEYTGESAAMQGQIYGAEVMGRIWRKKSGMSNEDFRLALDKSAVQSHVRANAHVEDRAKEIEPIMVPKVGPDRKIIPGEMVLETGDSSMRNPEGMLKKIQKLKGIVKRKSGILTAGNSCPTTDGAAMSIITSREFAEEHSLKIRGTIESFATIGSDSVLWLTGPIEAVPVTLKRAEMTMDDMKVIEINEAFSTVVQASCYELGIPMDDERLNPWGGAMALGHPTGMTGCRLVGTILHQLEKKQEDVGLATLCVGLGMGIGVVVRREGS